MSAESSKLAQPGDLSLIEGPKQKSRSATPGQAAQTLLAAPPTLAENGPLEADDFVADDGDSPYQSPIASDTKSLSASVFAYRRENGRSYHSFKSDEGVKYFLPNDEAELDRLDLQHHQNILMQGGQLYSSPAGKDGKPLGRVLDVGTGTGLWATEIADQHPEATILGVDLSPTQPDFVPPNVHFEIDNLEEEWNFSDPFDFVYIRMMAGSIKDWDKLIKQSYENLNPGGWVELLDPSFPARSDDGTLAPDSPLAKYNELWLEASTKAGSPVNAADNHKQRLIDAGFINVTQVEYKWPIGPWPKEKNAKLLGTWVYQNCLEGLEAFSMFLFTNVLGWSPEQVQVFLVDVRKDLKNPRIHAYTPAYVVYGQRPE